LRNGMRPRDTTDYNFYRRRSACYAVQLFILRIIYQITAHNCNYLGSAQVLIIQAHGQNGLGLDQFLLFKKEPFSQKQHRFHIVHFQTNNQHIINTGQLWQHNATTLNTWSLATYTYIGHSSFKRTGRMTSRNHRRR